MGSVEEEAPMVDNTSIDNCIMEVEVGNDKVGS
jgi:hypothetical protein